MRVQMTDADAEALRVALMRHDQLTEGITACDTCPATVRFRASETLDTLYRLLLLLEVWNRTVWGSACQLQTCTDVYLSLVSSVLIEPLYENGDRDVIWEVKCKMAFLPRRLVGRLFRPPKAHVVISSN